MKVERTYEELQSLNVIAGGYMARNKDNKVSEALEKMFAKQIKNHFSEYTDLLDDLQRNNCLVDTVTNAVTYVDRKQITNGVESFYKERQYTIAGEAKLKAEKKILLKKKVILHARIVEGIDDLIKEMTEEEREAFSGLVIPDQKIETEQIE